MVSSAFIQVEIICYACVKLLPDNRTDMKSFDYQGAVRISGLEVFIARIRDRLGGCSNGLLEVSVQVSYSKGSKVKAVRLYWKLGSYSHTVNQLGYPRLHVLRT